MGRQELIDALRRRGDEQALALWCEAEAEAARMRQEAGLTLDRARHRSQARQQAAAAEQERRVRLKAEQNARAIHSEARRELAERLRLTALATLATLRQDGYQELFARLVDELPDGRWSDIRVNPDDLLLASRHFPGARAHPDPGLSGGFIAASEDGRIRIDNTLEKRLERVWDDLAPRLLGGLSTEGPRR